ncbi:MAG: D-lyxose/D-mannose family sugar isomerase [Eubacteriales bacterium]|nr:D-lyxose/D-mannose family sugar isomerase [Eubacteriales bacterium]
MKRSEINNKLKENIEFIKKQNFNLPPFAWFTPDEWKEKGHEYDEIRNHMLGWDITDYGHGDFNKIGLFLFTIRNGSLSEPDCKKTYAEKLLISDEDQYSPMHFHYHKMEDIINRGGGNLIVEVYNCGENETLADTPVTVTTDGYVRTVPAGTKLCLTPGESITLPPYQYHAFWGEKGRGKVLIGEVSMVNDDKCDNRFYETMGRFPQIEEDEAPLYYLCGEYPKAF